MKDYLEFVNNKAPLRDRRQKGNHFISVNSSQGEFEMIKFVEDDGRTDLNIKINETSTKQNKTNAINQYNTPYASRDSPIGVTL